MQQIIEGVYLSWSRGSRFINKSSLLQKLPFIQINDSINNFLVSVRRKSWIINAALQGPPILFDEGYVFNAVQMAELKTRVLEASAIIAF